MKVTEAQEQLRKAIKDLTGCDAKVEVSIFDIRNPQLRDTGKAIEVAAALRNDTGESIEIRHHPNSTCIAVGNCIRIFV